MLLSYKKFERDFIVRKCIADITCPQCFVYGGFLYPHVSYLNDNECSCRHCLLEHFDIDNEIFRKEFEDSHV